MNAAHIVATLVLLAIAAGATIQIVSNPGAANTVFAAGANSVLGAEHALEGK